MATVAATDVDVARAFADAYAAVDLERFLEVADDRLRHRELNPGGFLEYVGARERIDKLAVWLEPYGNVEVLEIGAEPIRDRVWTKNVWRLGGGNRTWLLRFDELLTIEGGRVVAADVLCAGPNEQQ